VQGPTSKETGPVSAPRKFDLETQQRAVRMYADRVRDGGSKLGARRKVGELLGVNPATLRNWIEAAEKADRPSSRRGCHWRMRMPD
jgi:transposase-like protein